MGDHGRSGMKGMLISKLLAAAALALALGAAAPTLASAAPDGRFTSVCEFSHESQDDPIVFPRMPGAAHLHEFFGNPTTNARSTPRKLRRHPETTCNIEGDATGYWVPALNVDGAVVAPSQLRVYYSSKSKDPRTVEAIPKGLEMLAGVSHATVPQSPQVASWTCASGILSDLLAAPMATPSCPPGAKLVMTINFPDCWDGVNLDSKFHKSHVEYALQRPFGTRYRACPASHPVPIPAMSYRIIYPIPGGSSGVELSSGGIHSAHADFMNGWRQSVLRAKVEECIRAAIECRAAPVVPTG